MNQDNFNSDQNNRKVTVELMETRGTYRVLLDGQVVRAHLTTHELAMACARYVARNEGVDMINDLSKFPVKQERQS